MPYPNFPKSIAISTRNALFSSRHSTNSQGIPADEKNLSALLFRFEQCKTLEEIQDEVRKAKIRLKGEHYEEFRMALADWLWNTTTTKFKTRAPAKHKLDLEDVDSMLGETVAKIIEQKINDAILEREKELKKEMKLVKNH